MHPLCCACIFEWSLELTLTPSPAAAPAALSPVPMGTGDGQGMRPLLASTPVLGVQSNSDRPQGAVRWPPFLLLSYPYFLSRIGRPWASWDIGDAPSSPMSARPDLGWSGLAKLSC